MIARALIAVVICGGAIVAYFTATPTTPTAAENPVSVTDLTGLTNSVPYRGLAIQIATGYRAIETYGPLLDEIADLGANCVLLSVAGYMEHAQSQAIYIDHRKVPSAEDFGRLIGHARERGLKVVLMPIVLLRSPRGNDWRGVIKPPSWDAWWEEYEQFVLFFADIARESKADALIIGSELVSTEAQEDRWRHVISRCREYFHGGLLGYSANWDHYRPVRFWDALDFIGMTSYYKLAENPGASVEQLVERWRPLQADVLAWQRTIGKPILLTEVGWCSQEGAATAPWNYYHNQVATPAGMEEQRRLYEAFLRVWGASPELLGVIWWEWTTGPGGVGDFGYTPKGKPAERLLRQWLAAAARTPTSQPTTDAADAR